MAEHRIRDDGFCEDVRGNRHEHEAQKREALDAPEIPLRRAEAQEVADGQHGRPRADVDEALEHGAEGFRTIDAAGVQ